MPPETKKGADAPPQPAQAAAPAAPAETPPAETPPAARPPSPGESTSPDVHFLIATRRAHELVLEADGSTPESRRHAEFAIADVDKQLRELGFR